MDSPHSTTQVQDAAVRRVVGIAALRKLRRMVDADAASLATQRSRARTLLALILLALALSLVFLLHDVIAA